MARMLPPYCAEDIKSNAEKRVFEMLRHDPDTEDWICLHSLGLSKHVTQVYGEIDFVVLVPDEGVFCLEVKGGRVGRHEGKWTFTNRYGETTTRAKSPFMQARDGMFSLRCAIEAGCGKDHRATHIAYGYGVLFPDISWEQEDPEYEKWQIYDRDFRRPISAYIRQLARHTHDQLKRKHGYKAEEARPDHADVQEIAGILRGDFEAVVKPAAQADVLERELLRLTEEQYRCLDGLQANPRCLFEGGAGTGKTLLAMEYARREAQTGRHVLFLCYNRLLGQWAASRLSACEPAGVHAESFHRYLDCLIAQSSRADEFAALRSAPRNTTENQAFFCQDFPLFALDALSENVAELFDVLVVDEGQDLICSEYLDVLDGLLKGGLAGGQWAIFCDFYRQAIFTETTAEEMQALIDRYAPQHVRYRLNVNCRNTRPIIEETAAMSGFKTPPCLPSHIDGLSVEYVFYRDEAHQRDIILQQVHQLLDEGFAPERISILSRVRRENSCLAVLPDGLRCKIENLEESTVTQQKRGVILFATIHAFKGLENTVVILTDIDRLSGDNEAALLYVGMSRARQRLIVLVSQAARKDYNAAVRNKIIKEMAQV